MGNECISHDFLIGILLANRVIIGFIAGDLRHIDNAF